MMKSYYKLGAIAVTAVVASLVFAAPAVMAALAAPQTYLSIVTSNAESKNDNTSTFTASVADLVPPTVASTAPYAVYGYAWVGVDHSDGLIKGIALTIHPSFVDASQNRDAWHVHTVILKNGAKDNPKTAGDDLCVVGLGTPTAGITIDGANITVNARDSVLPISADVMTIHTAFVVQGDSGCKTTGLGVATVS